jgi:hypothetical protein
MAIIAILVLAIGGVLLIKALRCESTHEGCLISGRINCAPTEAPTRG